MLTIFIVLFKSFYDESIWFLDRKKSFVENIENNFFRVRTRKYEKFGFGLESEPESESESENFHVKKELILVYIFLKPDSDSDSDSCSDSSPNPKIWKVWVQTRKISNIYIMKINYLFILNWTKIVCLNRNSVK